jgi:hypothetical protein
MLELDKKFKGFRKYLRSHGSFTGTTTALHRDLKFMGESGDLLFLWLVARKFLPVRSGCIPRLIKANPANLEIHVSTRRSMCVANYRFETTLNLLTLPYL